MDSELKLMNKELCELLEKRDQLINQLIMKKQEQRLANEVKHEAKICDQVKEYIQTFFLSKSI